jgi:uncharacterized protein
MTTNGILLDKYKDFFFENNFTLLISLDGNDENNTYRVFKNGKPAYNTILKNVKSLQKKYPEFFSKNVDFNAVLHNKNSVSDIYSFFKEHFNKSPLILELRTTGIKDSQKEKFWQIYANVYESLYQSEDYSLIEKDMFLRLPTGDGVSRFLHNCNDFCFKNYYELIYSKTQKRVPTATCLPFYKRIFVTVNGKILPCERIGYQHALGSVTADKVELNCEKIAETFNGYLNKMRKLCNICCNSELCIQCMFHLNIDVEGEKDVCKGFMTEKDHAKYLSALVSHVEEKPGTYSNILEEVVIE